MGGDETGRDISVVGSANKSRRSVCRGRGSVQSTVSNAEAAVLVVAGIACRDRGQVGGGGVCALDGKRVGNI